jgi:FAD/FMN-containing dehydrogenase
VRLLAGTRLHRIPALLAPHGLAMANLGDIDRQSIAGALSTGTHGTGLGHGGLATQVVGATLVTADGELLTVDDENEPDLLPAVALGLGALGILVDVTLQCVPAFALGAQEQPEPLDAVVDDLDARVRGVDHFEFYWFPHTAVALTKTNTRMPTDAPTAPLSPLSRCSMSGSWATACTNWCAAPGGSPAARAGDQSAVRPGVGGSAVLRRVASRVHHAAQRALPRDGVRRAAGRAGVGVS